MLQITFKDNIQLHYNWCGKFESPSPEWIHLTRDLLDFELIVMTEGILYIADSRREYTVIKGEYLLMPPDHFQHGYRQSNCSFYWLHFYVDAHGFILKKSNEATPENAGEQFPCHGQLSFPERIIILMKQLQDSDKRYHNKKLNEALSTAIIQEIYSQSAEYQKNQENKKTLQICNDISDFISYHATENLLVSDIAAYFGYNEKYLSTLFKKYTGISLKQFMIQTKMDIAKGELTDTNHSISQIAYNVGFDDNHNFTNAFKKVTGLTPSAYRESFAKRALFHK